jgi:hypothetical protein
MTGVCGKYEPSSTNGEKLPTITGDIGVCKAN